MESTNVIIARLVLGYLKGEKCVSAYKEFLRNSNHLQDTNLSTRPTRFVGLTLEDILSEYFEMYKIVQGQLEVTNYYSECHTKSSLVDQLLYLVNKVQSSRASTPCPRSPLDSNLDGTSPSYADQISDVEATPAHTLPGNIRCTSEDSYLNKTPRRKLHSKFSKPNTVAAISTTDREDMSEVLAQTLLENKEFHEKIAQTINKVAEKQYRVSSELDKTIKTVVKETEEDPIFDKILEEIIESTTMVDTSKGIETSSTLSSIAKNTNEPTVNRSKRTHMHSETIENEDLHCRSYFDSKKVEEQNNEAVRSIVANSKLAANMQVNNNEAHANSEVIVFDGSLDKYLISNTCNSNAQTQPVENPLYINAAGSLLMVPSTITTNAAGNLQIDTTRQYYFVNKQPAIGWNMPAIKTPNIITEQDILAMPTVIVNDEKQNKNINTRSVLQTPVLSTVKTSTLRTIVPKPTIEIPAEYLAVCGGQEQQQSNLKQVMYPKSTEKEQFTDTAINTNPADVKGLASTDVPNTAKSLPSDLLNESPQEPQTKGDIKFEHELPGETAAKTPPPPETVQKVTPKSASHVRNLDFSTPPKITSTHKKSIKASQRNKSPLFVHKKQAAKTLSMSQNIADNDNKSKEAIKSKNDIKQKNRPSAYTWDADLRAIIVSEEDVKSNIVEKKRKAPVKKVKRKLKKVDKRVEQQLNTTDQDAALLEAALQSPIKTEREYLKRADMKVESAEDEIKETACISANEQSKSCYNTNNTELSSKKISEQQSSDITEDNSNKMILSPSKLNANKRNLVNTNSVKTHVIKEETKDNGDLRASDEKNKFVTPEMAKENVLYPVKVNRNIMPMLATPLKNELPKTPGIQTPVNHTVDSNLSMSCSIFTPFSKMLEENLKGVDITSFPTPNIPITPNFPPLTPSVDLLSPYSNRPTDYSTSSSYYQPSDSEQNRSLEANVMELEKKPVKILSDVIVKEEVPSNKKIDKATDKVTQNRSTHPTALNEHLNIFNKNVIGKKNLNLMKQDMSSSSSSSDDTSVGSSSEDDCSGMWEEKESNDTVICKSKPVETPKRIYSLRNRTTTLNDKEASKKPTEVKKSKVNKKANAKDTKVNSNRSAKVISKQVDKLEIVEKEIITEEEIVNAKSTEISKVHHKVLKELEEKRLRTIDKFKNVEKTTSKKSSTKLPTRQPKGKFMKIKPLSNITNSKKRHRKSESPKKTTQAKLGNINNKIPDVPKDNLSDNKNTDNNISLDLSASEDEDEKLGISCKAKASALNMEKNDKSASDVEAQNLIEGLKKRGIHLMHNKSSPNKKVNETSTEFKAENKEMKRIENTDFPNCLSSVKTDSSDILETSSLETKENELSTIELESELRETYDTRLFEEENVRIVFDESQIVTKTLEDYNTKMLAKTFIGKVFVEEINKEIDVPLVFSPLYTLLDIPQTGKLEVRAHKTDFQKNEANDKVIQSEKICNRKESVEENDLAREEACLIKDVSNPTACEETIRSDDDLMNYAIIGSAREETPESSDSPKSTRKRKLRSGENSHTEKKCKTLLSQLNLETFLDNIHGEN